MTFQRLDGQGTATFSVFSSIDALCGEDLSPRRSRGRRQDSLPKVVFFFFSLYMLPRYGSSPWVRRAEGDLIPQGRFSETAPEVCSRGCSTLPRPGRIRAQFPQRSAPHFLLRLLKSFPLIVVWCALSFWDFFFCSLVRSIRFP